MKKTLILFCTVIFTISCEGQNQDIVYIISEYDYYIKKNQQFIEEKGKNLKLRKELEGLTEDKLPLLLKQTEQIVCSTEKPNKKLINKFLELISKTKNSANEEPYSIFFKIYKCNTEIVDYLVRHHEDREFLLESLKWGNGR